MPLSGKITVWGFDLLFLLSSILNLGRIEALFFLIYALINAGVAIYLYHKTGIGYKSIWLVGAFSYLTTTTLLLRVEYINGEMNATFLTVAIVAAVILFVPGLIYGIRSFRLYRDWDKLIGVPVLALLGGFAIVWLTVGSMNVYLDFSSPTYEEYIVIDKHIQSGAKQITAYVVEVKNGDKSFTIGISENAYYRYNLNDTIELSIYEGAFHEPYYIHDNNTD